MLFRNEKDHTVKVRMREKVIGGMPMYAWYNIKPGESRDLPEPVGRAYCLVPHEQEQEEEQEQEQESTQAVEEEQDEEQEEFIKELCDIKGVGKKTAQDIVAVFPTKQALVDAINTSMPLPVRDDIAFELIRLYK